MRLRLFHPDHHAKFGGKFAFGRNLGHGLFPINALLTEVVRERHQPGLHIVAAGGGLAAYVHRDRARGLPADRLPAGIHGKFFARDGAGNRIAPELRQERINQHILAGGKASCRLLNDETLRHTADGRSVPNKFVRQTQADGRCADVLLQMLVELLVRPIHYEGLDILRVLHARNQSASENAFAGQVAVAVLAEVAKESLRADVPRGVFDDEADAAASLCRHHLKAKKFVPIQNAV